jgi:N-carbamoylputrescine amidase
MRHLPARAYDNSLFVVACNQTGENGNGLSFPGLAMVLDPSGNVMAKDLSGKEGLLIADLDADALERVRNHPMRFFLPNRRADIFQKL